MSLPLVVLLMSINRSKIIISSLNFKDLIYLQAQAWLINKEGLSGVKFSLSLSIIIFNIVQSVLSSKIISKPSNLRESRQKLSKIYFFHKEIFWDNRFAFINSLIIILIRIKQEFSCLWIFQSMESTSALTYWTLNNTLSLLILAFKYGLIIRLLIRTQHQISKASRNWNLWQLVL